MAGGEVGPLFRATGDDALAGRQPREFLIASQKQSCRECWGCVRYCPARAIRVVHGHSEIIEERCVKCGLCVSECGNAGHAVRDDTERVRELLASGRPVIAVLATEFVAALHPLSPAEVERALEAVGFFAVESTLLGEELVALEYERTHARPCASLMLRSTCPVAVDWVRIFYPTLVPALSPIVPPYIAQARLVRELYPPEAAVVYVSPCYARKDEVFDPQFEGAVDAAIDFAELEKLMAGARPRPPYATPAGSRRPQPIKEISLTDGFPRRTMTERDGTDTTVRAVRGLDALDRLLGAIVRGEDAPTVVDMLACEGCIDGPAVRPGLSVFAKRNIVSAERNSAVRARVSTRSILGHLPSVDLIRSFSARPVFSIAPSAEEIDATLAQGEFASRADALDCGACGYATCVEHAVAIIQGHSSWDMCFPLQRRRMRAAAEQLERTARTDTLTGLANRRHFDEQIAEEVARIGRYSGNLSLLMIDVDGFKHVNDEYGHVPGDEVLKAVASTLAGSVRETDLVARYGGDEFAIVLTGTGKTAAFAVAEKLRESVAALKIRHGETTLKVTISLGVGSSPEKGATITSLIESADRALYHAKKSGRNQVRIS